MVLIYYSQPPKPVPTVRVAPVSRQSKWAGPRVSALEALVTAPLYFGDNLAANPIRQARGTVRAARPARNR